MRLRGKVIVIPGVGGGMGTALARLCAREGAKLLLVARREGPLLELAEPTRKDGGEAAVFTADAATEDGANAMIEAAVREFGRVDGLYSNLGDYAFGEQSTHETTPEQWDYLLDVNLRAHYLTAMWPTPGCICFRMRATGSPAWCCRSTAVANSSPTASSARLRGRYCRSELARSRSLLIAARLCGLTEYREAIWRQNSGSASPGWSTITSGTWRRSGVRPGLNWSPPPIPTILCGTAWNPNSASPGRTNLSPPCSKPKNWT